MLRLFCCDSNKIGDKSIVAELATNGQYQASSFAELTREVHPDVAVLFQFCQQDKFPKDVYTATTYYGHYVRRACPVHPQEPSAI